MAQLRLIQRTVQNFYLDVQSSAQYGHYAFPKETKSPQTDELMDFHHRDYVEDGDEKQQQITLLYKVIKMLLKVERAIVMMYLDHLPYRDIAENLGITEVNARVKMNRLKKTLKELMTQHA